MADEKYDIFDSESDDSAEEHREAQATVSTFFKAMSMFLKRLKALTR